MRTSDAFNNSRRPVAAALFVHSHAHWQHNMTHLYTYRREDTAIIRPSWFLFKSYLARPSKSSVCSCVRVYFRISCDIIIFNASVSFGFFIVSTKQYDKRPTICLATSRPPSAGFTIRYALHTLSRVRIYKLFLFIQNVSIRNKKWKTGETPRYGWDADTDEQYFCIA